MPDLPTEDLARRAKKLVARRGMDVRVEVAELEAAVSLARRLLAEDDYLFISRRGTRDLLRKSLKIQVVNIPGRRRTIFLPFSSCGASRA